MAPLIYGAIIAGGALATAVMNNSEAAKARGAKKDEIERMKAIAAALKNPQFDTRLLLPEDYALAEKYSPALAEYIQQKAPVLVQANSQGAVAGRQAQMQTLGKFQNLAQTGEDAQSQMLRENAMNAAARQNAAQQGAIKSRFEQQGRGGSAMDYVSSLIAQQGANQAAHGSAQDAAMQAYNTRIQAARDAAQLGGRIRGEDVDVESQNANTINNYNSQMANSYQRYLNERADTQNRAQMYNIEMTQKVKNANTAQKNAAILGHQGVINGQRQAQFNNDVNRGNIAIGVGGTSINGINSDYANQSKAYGDIFTGLSKGVGAGFAYGHNYKNQNQNAPPPGYDDPNYQRPTDEDMYGGY